MSLASRFAAVSGLAVAVTIAMGAPAMAAPSGHDGQSGGDPLVNVSNNNIGPFQVCNNDVPVNVGGVQVPAGDLAAALGIDNDANSAESSKDCGQASEQSNDGTDPYAAGDSDGDSLVSVSDNNVGPFQVCNNDVPVNVGGVQVPASALAAVLGIDNDANSAESSKNCGQDSEQHNDVDAPVGILPVE